MTHKFTVLIEQGEDGAYIATVPALKSCYTQAGTIPELLEKTQEVIELCLDVQKEIPVTAKFVGVQQMEVAL
jgi:predicted RNase H-like HicB family nuclease